MQSPQDGILGMVPDKRLGGRLECFLCHAPDARSLPFGADPGPARPHSLPSRMLACAYAANIVVVAALVALPAGTLCLCLCLCLLLVLVVLANKCLGCPRRCNGWPRLRSAVRQGVSHQPNGPQSSSQTANGSATMPGRANRTGSRQRLNRGHSMLPARPLPKVA